MGYQRLVHVPDTHEAAWPSRPSASVPLVNAAHDPVGVVVALGDNMIVLRTPVPLMDVGQAIVEPPLQTSKPPVPLPALSLMNTGADPAD